MAPRPDEPDRPRWQPAPWTVPDPTDEDPDPTGAVPLDARGEPIPPDEDGGAGVPTSPAVPVTPDPAASWPPPDPTATMPVAGTDRADLSASDRHPEDHRGDPAGGPRRLGPILGGAIAVLVLLIVVVILAVALLADDGPPSEPASPETTTTVVDEDRDIEIQGVRIVIPAGSLDPGAELDVSLRSMPTSHLSAFEPVSPFLRVAVTGGEQRGPIRFEFPIEARRIGLTEDEPVLLTLLGDDPDVRLHDGRWDSDRRLQIVELDEVTDIGVATWDWRRIERIVDGAVDARIGSPHGAQPCGSTPPEVSGTSSTAMSWCVEDGDPRIVRGRNLAAHAIDVTWSGATLEAVDDPTALGDLLERISGQSGDGRRTLGPGGSIALLVPAGGAAAISSEYGDDAAAATRIGIDADTTADIAALLTPGEAIDGDTLLRELDTDCVDRSLSPADLWRDCLDPPSRRAAYGEDIEDRLGTILTPRIPGRRISEAVDLIHDDLVTRSSTSVRITPARIRGGTWPTHAQDAPQNPDHDWSRCIGHACIVGVGDEVELYRWTTDDWVAVGRTPLDTDDPAGALLDLGASEDEMRTFLGL